MQKLHRKDDHGSILVTVLIMLIFLTTLIFGLLLLANENLFRARSRILLLQAQYAAESGADAAIAALNNSQPNYTGTTSPVTLLSNSQYRATFSTTVTTGTSDKQRIIVSKGFVYAPASRTKPNYTRIIRVTAQRSSGTAALSLMSRNILSAPSGVKNIIAKDIYVNGFINLPKNTIYLTAENITVAGKDTGVGNCSIESTGNLLKPATFTNTGQTKTNITLAYNNCINPPGNTSNADFNIAANQTNLTTIQSMYIPWGQYMDSTYTAAGSCSDWTSAASTLTIPSTNGSKRTHYPDTGSNISSSCGSSGDISLGTKTVLLSDNVHLRANLCATTACSPIFKNTTSSLIYVFVEGIINLNSLNTASGSGPIVFVSYGTDPPSKASVCPYGGAIYVGNTGTTSAPQVYLLAMNGICMDQTKFGSSPAIGGIGGKNIYIATNPGTPFDLKLDPAFPVSQIPVDLSWRQTGYERLTN